MFSKSFIALISVFALTASVNAHAAVAPLLGVNGDPKLSDVQKPTASAPCGNVDISDNLSTSTAAAANSDGEFIINITNFDTTDGSRKINTVDIDSTGTGNNFNTQGTVIANGDASPTNLSTQQLLAQLASNTACTGGPNKNLCLVSITTTDNFGNCVVVSQTPGAGVGSSTSASATSQAAATGAAGVANTR